MLMGVILPYFALKKQTRRRLTLFFDSLHGNPSPLAKAVVLPTSQPRKTPSVACKQTMLRSFSLPPLSPFHMATHTHTHIYTELQFITLRKGREVLNLPDLFILCRSSVEREKENFFGVLVAKKAGTKEKESKI